MIQIICDKLFLFLLFTCLLSDDVNGYISSSGRYSRDSNWRNDCPEKCQCMSLSRRGARGILDRWGVTGRWRSDSARTNNDGRTMVCQGLRRLPNPIPSDIITLTIYGDSSSVISRREPADEPQRDHHRPLMTSTQLRHISSDSFRHNLRLSEITLSGNNLGVLYPYIFNHLRRVRRLSLQNNNIRHLSAAVFRGLIQLEELEMSDNTIQYLPQAVFNYVSNLRSLNLNGNKIQRLQRNQFKSLINLRRLDLSRNNISVLYDDSFDRNLALEELLLSGNRIRMVRARWFQNLSKLRILSLRGNAITYVSPDSFSNLYNLQELLLSANHIVELQDESFRNLRKLKTLDLATNDIIEIKRSTFIGLRSLEELYLTNNKLTHIDNGTFHAMRTVIRLDLSRNHIESIESEAFYPLRTLQYLDISHNKLRTILPRLVYGLIELKELKLDHNFIRVIQKGAFVTAPGSRLSKLTSLSLQFNDIRKLDSETLIGLTKLKSLSLNNNKIRRVHSLAFSPLQNLNTLNLNKNRIKRLDNGALRSLQQLLNLDLTDNKIRAIPINMFSGLNRLEELKIATNGMHDISTGAFSSLDNLYELDMKENKLMNFNFSLLSNMRSLYSLDLSDNHIFWIDIPQNSSVLRIKELFLSSNNLQTVKKDVQKVLMDPSFLFLSGNPLSCDCQLTWMRNPAIIRSVQINQLDELVCRSPPHLNGKKINRLKISEMSCTSRDYQGNQQSLVCSDVLDIKPTTRGGRTGVKAIINRHITVLDEQKIPKYNGLLLQNNWAVVPGNALKDIQQSTHPEVRVKLGRRKGTRRVVHVIKHPLGSIGMEQYNIGLLHLDGNDKVDPVCLMTVNQFDTVMRILPKASVTTRIDGRTPFSKLKARRGKIHTQCTNPNYVCAKVNGNRKGKKPMLLDGSPMYVGQLNDLKVAGLGTGIKDPGNKDSLFIPLWTVTGWLDHVISEYDAKCPIQMGNAARCSRVSLPTASELLSELRRPERH